MSKVGHCVGELGAAADSRVNPARMAAEMEVLLPATAGFVAGDLFGTGREFPGASNKLVTGYFAKLERAYSEQALRL
jgi:hypothetical protein